MPHLQGQGRVMPLRARLALEGRKPFDHDRFGPLEEPRPSGLNKGHGARITKKNLKNVFDFFENFYLKCTVQEILISISYMGFHKCYMQ